MRGLFDTSDGGWVLASQANLNTLGEGSYEYLYVGANDGWYISPVTNYVWSWTTYQPVGGDWTYGQGDATLITASTGETLLVDGGRSKSRIRTRLETLGITDLDAIAMHHPDPDHKKFGAEVVVHLKDGTGTRGDYQGAVIGDGEIDIPRAIQALKNAGYGGTWCIEYEGKEGSAGYAQCLDRLKAQI